MSEVEPAPDARSYHSPEETADAIGALPDSFFLNLQEWAAWKLADNGIAEAGDVIADVYERFLAGTRRWPKGVEIAVCFKNAVRSVISDLWEQNERAFRQHHSPLDADGAPADPFEAVLDPTDGRPMEPLLVEDPVSELVALAEQKKLADILEEIESAFAKDDAVTAILIGLEQGLRAEEIQESFGLSETAYDTARKRLRRHLNKNYPNQWR